MNDPAVTEMAEFAFADDKSCDAIILALDGKEIDRRMLAQMGRFTIHGYPVPIELLPRAAQWLQRYVIPKDAKAKIKNQLAALGVRRSNMFPDLENLAAELKNARFV